MAWRNLFCLISKKRKKKGYQLTDMMLTDIWETVNHHSEKEKVKSWEFTRSSQRLTLSSIFQGWMRVLPSFFLRLFPPAARMMDWPKDINDTNSYLSSHLSSLPSWLLLLCCGNQRLLSQGEKRFHQSSLVPNSHVYLTKLRGTLWNAGPSLPEPWLVPLRYCFFPFY